MDDGQKWAVACTRMALEDYGSSLDRERTAVILGNDAVPIDVGTNVFIVSVRGLTLEVIPESEVV